MRRVPGAAEAAAVAVAVAAVGSITRAKGIASFEAIKDHARRNSTEVLVSLVSLVTISELQKYCCISQDTRDTIKINQF